MNNDIEKCVIRGYNSELDVWMGLDVYLVKDAKHSYNIYDKYGGIKQIVANNIFDGFFHFKKYFGTDLRWFQIINDDSQVLLDSLAIKSEIFKWVCKNEKV